MGYEKKHDHRKPYKKVICINANGSNMLNSKYFYGVLEDRTDQYLIQFSNGGAKWYLKSRFIDVPSKKPPAEPENVNALF